MTIRIYVCRIEVDEDALKDDFAYEAPAIEDVINAIDGCAVHSWSTEEY